MAELHELIGKIENPELRAQIQEAANKLFKQKKFGLVFEDHLPECTPLYDIPVRKGSKVSLKDGKVSETYTVLKIENGQALCLPSNNAEAVSFPVKDLVTTAEFGDPIYPCLKSLGEVCNAPDSDLWHTLIEADNYHALQLLEYLYAGKVDCIYIDPPYNTGARDWKYNNDYVDGNDSYRHSKWLSMMEKRLKLAKRLLNPDNSVLIVTIDEKEYLHLGCLLEELFPEANMQMISTVINPKGTARTNEFSRVDEYIFFVMIGDYKLTRTGKDMLTQDVSEDTSVRWRGFPRTGRKGLRPVNPGSWYPIYFNVDDDSFHSVGEAVYAGQDNPTAPDGTYAIWPPVRNGEEYSWSMVPATFRYLHGIGAIKFGRPSKSKGCSISYLTNNQLKQIEEGKIVVTGRDANGSLEVAYASDSKTTAPKTQWNLTSHEAGAYGTNVIGAIIPGRRFAFPKSIYAVADALRFFVKEKPDALIVDFFAGSGTTLHAVNLLNAEDSGHRRCIMVTNNEVSEAEAKKLSAQGYHPGDNNWDNLGIARYVTWPRTVCSIEGHDINGQPLKGSYLGSDRPMADGFPANAAFFKLGFLDKTKVSLGMQFKELLSTLWMKAGAIGKCPTVEEGVPDMLILPENKMAILNNENRFAEFAEELAMQPEIDVIFIVTDYEAGFVAMSQALEGKTTYQLYRDYLDNFRINAGRNSR
ncbi:MAG: site-specific DNA-methyltransferase [Oscillospiraceae bacterium]|nr:site-specific DNA-methyltransferase [Oscillospiraceae bacterium]